MNKPDRVEITNRQMVFSLVSILIGISVLGIPRLVAEDAQQDGWIAVILGALPTLPAIILMIYLFRRFPGQNFYQVCSSVLGKYIGKIPIFIYIIYGIFFCSTILRVFADLLSTYTLPKTPRYIKMLLVLAVILYITQGGIKTVARFNELSYFLFLPLYFFLLPPLKNAEWTFLQPFAATPFDKLLSASATTAFAYTGYEYILVLYPFLNNKKPALKSSMQAFAIVVFTYLYVTVLTTVVFGPYSIRRYVWPVIVSLKTVDVPVIERMEFFFILLWVGVAFRPVLNQFFAVSYFASQLFKVKEYRRVTIPIILIIYILALLPPNSVKNFKYSDYVGIAGIIYVIAVPAILVFLAVIFRKGAKANGRKT